MISRLPMTDSRYLSRTRLLTDFGENGTEMFYDTLCWESIHRKYGADKSEF